MRLGLNNNDNETQSQQGVGAVAQRDPCYTYISYTSL